MNRLLIFGCGRKAKEVSRYINKRHNKVLCYIDNNVQNAGGVFGKTGHSAD